MIVVHVRAALVWRGSCEEGWEKKATLMIGTDIMNAFVKKSDWLRPTVDELMWRIRENRYSTVSA